MLLAPRGVFLAVLGRWSAAEHLADDLGWTDTSVQIDPNVPNSKSDYYQTANLEALAAAGMRFTNAYASSPVCSPTRASIQTGKTPAQLHMTDILSGGQVGSVRRQSFYHDHPLIPPLPLKILPDEEVTIAEHLKMGNPNYRTSHHQKWDLVTVEERLPQHADILAQGYDVANTGFRVFPEGTDPYVGEGATLKAMTFMEETVAMGRPFYTQISYLNVHTPYDAKQATIDKYEALPPGQRHDQPLYAAVVEELDTLVGQLLAKLDELNIADNTYVFFTSDNGGRSGPSNGTQNDPLFHGKGSIWEGGLRVPLLVRGPNIQANTVSDVPVATYDFLSTFGDLAGISNPEPVGVEGTSIVPILENGGNLPAGMSSLVRAHGSAGELFFHYPHYVRDTGEGPRVPASAIRDGDYKLVKVYGENGAPDDIFLFDLAANITESDDPNSPLNLADSLPAQTALMLNKLEDWLIAVNADLPVDAGGDFNLDEIVDDADLTAWDTNYGKIGATHAEGDANGDAIADGIDFLIWQEQYTGAPVPSADFDNSGQVDEIDLSLWEAAFGLDDGADADRDGDSDGNDFLIWQQQFADAAPFTSAAQVPEPEGMAWMLIAGCLLAQSRSRLRPW